MWSFDQLRLVLPAGFAGRAERIARRVADELGAIPAPGHVSLSTLSLPPIEIRPGADDGEIARAIARTIAETVRGGGSAPGKP